MRLLDGLWNFGHVTEHFLVRSSSAFSLSKSCSRILILCQSPPSSRFKTRPQDLTSRSTRSGSLLFYSSDFRWSPFAFNVRELSYLKNLMHPGTVYSTSSVNSNPSSNSFIDRLLCFGTLYIACEANLRQPSFPNSLYRSLLLSFVRYALHRLIPFPINPLIHL